LSVSLLPCYCLSFVSLLLAMLLSVFCQSPFGHVRSWQKTDNIMDKGKLTKDRQYQGQREAEKRQTISWPKGSWQKTYNIMDKGKLSASFWPWYCLSFFSFLLAMMLSVFCQFPFAHDIVCLLSVSLWPWYYYGQRKTDKRHTISWPKGNWQKTDNIMAKGKLKKDRQYHGQRETDKRQTISWPKGNWQKTDNIMAKGKLDIVCLLPVSLWPWYCLSFVTSPLTMIFSLFCHFIFGHDIVCLLSLHLWPRETDKRQTISWLKRNWQKRDNIMAREKLTKDRQYHGQREIDKRQTISWPKGNWQKTDNIIT
jgi:hypothetical protein